MRSKSRWLQKNAAKARNCDLRWKCRWSPADQWWTRDGCVGLVACSCGNSHMEGTSPSLSTCGLRMNSCEREGRGKRKDKPPKTLPFPSVPLPLTFQSLLRSSPSEFQLHHPMHWSPHERSATQGLCFSICLLKGWPRKCLSYTPWIMESPPSIPS